METAFGKIDSNLNVQLDAECAQPVKRIVFPFLMDSNYFYTSHYPLACSFIRFKHRDTSNTS